MAIKLQICLMEDSSGQEHPIHSGYLGLTIGQKEIIRSTRPREISITKCTVKDGILMLWKSMMPRRSAKVSMQKWVSGHWAQIYKLNRLRQLELWTRLMQSHRIDTLRISGNKCLRPKLKSLILLHKYIEKMVNRIKIWVVCPWQLLFLATQL